MRNRQLLYQNPLRVVRKHQQNHLPQKELKESTNFLNCLMTLYLQPTEDEQLTIIHFQKAHAEVTRYSDQPSTQENPLHCSNAFRLPILIHVVESTWLYVPATSVPSERAFSPASHIINTEHACHLPSSVNMLVFLAENLQ